MRTIGENTPSGTPTKNNYDEKSEYWGPPEKVEVEIIPPAEIAPDREDEPGLPHTKLSTIPKKGQESHEPLRRSARNKRPLEHWRPDN